LLTRGDLQRFLRDRIPLSTAMAVRVVAADPGAWEQFVATYRRKKLARISVKAVLRCGDELVGEPEAAFVALALNPA
jgi:hypothetical protein